jgi:hypothetical protein
MIQLRIQLHSLNCLRQKHHKMNSGPLTLQFKQKKMQMELKNTRNTNNEGGQNSYHSH